MDKITPVYVPLVNPNEQESILAQLGVVEGQKVKRGDLLAVFETTKSTLELTADREGYILGLHMKEGDNLAAGKRLCYLADSKDSILPREEPEVETQKTSQKAALPGELRITQPALALARSLGVDPESFPKGKLITEADVRAKGKSLPVSTDPNTLIIYGGGGHAKSLIDLIRAEGKYIIAGIVDDGLPAGTNVMGVPVLGGGDILADLKQKGISLAVNAVGGIGNITPRLIVYEKLKNTGFSCPTVIHPRAFIEPGAKIGESGQIFFNAYVGSDAVVGYGCIINTGAIISHDCVLEDYVNISPGAILAGAVTVQQRTLVGMGVTINLNVKIGAGARIGNSAVVKADVPENGIVRAGMVWPADPQ
jgi:sugar O-acyltransferase (sialic acid O-acetyltransferase NeuD family)